MVDKEVLMIKIEAEDNASSILKKVRKNLKKFETDEDKVKYLTSQMASFTSQCRKANEQTKKLVSTLRKPIQKAIQEKKFNIKTPKLENKKKIPPNIIPPQASQKGILKEGKLIQAVTNKENQSLKETYQRYDKLGNKVTDYYKRSKNGQLELDKSVTNFSKKKNPIQKLLSKYKLRGNEEDKSGSDTGLGRIKRIFQSIIAFRLASAGINLFINSFRQGIEALKQSGSELSKPFEKFNQATMAIKVSLGTIVIPLVQTLTSLLDPLSNKMIDLANAIAFNNAQAQGQTEYYKLSREKIDEYTKSLQKANKQLTQLDKFATLSGKKSFALGEVVNIDPNTEEGIANIKEGEKLNETYTEFVTTLNTIKNILEDIIGVFKKLGSKGSVAILGIAFAVGAIANPLTGILAMFGSFMVLMSDASIGAKALAGTILTLAGAFTALAIAKAFNISKTKGLAIAALIGGAVGGAITGIGLMVNNSSKTSESGSSDTLTTDTSSSYSSAMSSSQTLSTTSNEGTSVTTQVKEIIMDAKKVGEMVVDTVIYNAKKRNLI